MMAGAIGLEQNEKSETRVGEKSAIGVP